MKSKAWKSDKRTIYLSATQIKKEAKNLVNLVKKELLERPPCNDTMEHEAEQMKKQPFFKAH